MKTDREQIWDLLVHYCFLVDTGRAIDVADAIFTEDGIDDHGHGFVQGRDAIREMFASSTAVLERTCHSLSNHALLIEDDAAQSRCYCTAWHWSRTTESAGPLRPADFVSVGAYMDQLRRVDGRWLIKHRRCHLLGPQGLTIGSVTPELESMMANLAKNGLPGDILNPNVA